MSCGCDVKGSLKDSKRVPSMTILGRDPEGIPYMNFCRSMEIRESKLFTGLLTPLNLFIPRRKVISFISDRIYSDGRPLIPANTCFHFKGDPSKAVIDYFNVTMDRGEELLGVIELKQVGYAEVERLKARRKETNELIEMLVNSIDGLDLIMGTGVESDEYRD